MSVLAWLNEFNLLSKAWFVRLSLDYSGICIYVYHLCLRRKQKCWHFIFCRNCRTWKKNQFLASQWRVWWNNSIEFSLNVFTDFAEFSDKNICQYNKRAQTCHPATSCVRDQDATTAPARHMWATGSFTEFRECLFHLGKTKVFNEWNLNLRPDVCVKVHHTMFWS